MTRLTLRLPADLSERLRDESRRAGVSLNQMIVATLRTAITQSQPTGSQSDPLKEQVQHVRTALRDLVTEIDLSQFPPNLRPHKEDFGGDRPVSNAPQLNPPLSETILEERREQG